MNGDKNLCTTIVNCVAERCRRFIQQNGKHLNNFCNTILRRYVVFISGFSVKRLLEHSVCVYIYSLLELELEACRTQSTPAYNALISDAWRFCECGKGNKIYYLKMEFRLWIRLVASPLGAEETKFSVSEKFPTETEFRYCSLGEVCSNFIRGDSPQRSNTVRGRIHPESY
jgi:hypothetical protein